MYKKICSDCPLFLHLFGMFVPDITERREDKTGVYQRVYPYFLYHYVRGFDDAQKGEKIRCAEGKPPHIPLITAAYLSSEWNSPYTIHITHTYITNTSCPDLTR